MMASRFAEFSSGSGVPQCTAFFSSNKGQGSSAKVSWSLPQGQFYFVVLNPWKIQSTFTTNDGIKAASS
jgi:hypothetical protein